MKKEPEDEPAKMYPHLFQEVIWPWGPTRARFLLLEDPPPDEQISNVNLVPRIGELWVMLQLVDGSWEIPGGTREPGEGYLDTIKRELLEEAGAVLHSYQLLGAWKCTSLADQPYRSHLPHPEYYRLVMAGEISIDKTPENPPAAEIVKSVQICTLESVVERFHAQGRPDLAEIYLLAKEVYRK